MTDTTAPATIAGPDLAAAIAAHLPDGYTGRPADPEMGDHAGYIDRDGRPYLFIRVPGRYADAHDVKGSARALPPEGSTHDDHRYDDVHPEIGFTITRDPAKLAADITRRLLPQVDEWRHTIAARATARTQHAAKLEELAVRIAGAAAGTTNGTHDQPGDVRIYHNDPGDGYAATIHGTVKASGDRARFDVTVPADLALALAETIGNYQRARVTAPAVAIITDEDWVRCPCGGQVVEHDAGVRTNTGYSYAGGSVSWLVGDGNYERESLSCRDCHQEIMLPADTDEDWG